MDIGRAPGEVTFLQFFNKKTVDSPIEVAAGGFLHICFRIDSDITSEFVVGRATVNIFANSK
jgi:hypothetical protein